MRIDLNVPVGALGVLLPLGVASSMLSSASTGFLVSRLGLGRLLAASLAVSGLALFAQSLAPAFAVVIVAGVLLSAGNGAIDAGLNAHAARHFSARRITWMHAVYGFGAAAGPLLFAATAGAGMSWRVPFAVVAIVQVLLSTAFALTPRAFTAAAPAAGGPRPGLRIPAAVWPGAVLFAVQTGVEVTAALWAFIFLTEARGVGLGTAAATVSGYWAALLIGRLALGPVADRAGARPVLVAGLAGMVCGAVLLLLPAPLAVAGIVLIGLSAAPMYPLLMLTTKDRVGADLADHAVGIQAACSALGAAILPPLVGLLIGPVGAGVIAPCVLGLALANVVAYRVAMR
jgi:fucose permease